MILTEEEACEAIGIGRTTLYHLIGDGELKARKIGGKTIVLRADIDKYLQRLPCALPPKSKEKRREVAAIRLRGGAA